MILDNRYCGLFLDMGMGKTLSVLKALSIIKTLEGSLPPVLIIAPLRVARMTWPEEIQKWGFDFTYSVVVGTASQREKALQKEAEIYITNIENLVWVSNRWKFDIVVLDEASAFKATNTIRFKTFKKLRYKRLIALTGTPAPNGLIELWPMVYLLDHGLRLGRTVGHYRKTFFEPLQTNGYVVYKYGLKPGAEKDIYDAISDICISMQNTVRPESIINDIEFELSKEAQQLYNDFEADCYIEIENKEITALNAAVMVNKLSQLANGFLYSDRGITTAIHHDRLGVLKDTIDGCMGNNILIFAQYKEDIRAIVEEFGATHLNSNEDFARWNAGKISIAIAHPKSCGHGLNMQTGGHHIIWYSLTYSLETYLQANARLVRPGQTKTVIINRIIARNTVDEQIRYALGNKGISLKDLLTAIRK